LTGEEGVSRSGVEPSAVVADGGTDASVNAEGVRMLGKGPVSGFCVLASGFFGMSVFTRGPVVGRACLCKRRV